MKKWLAILALGIAGLGRVLAAAGGGSIDITIQPDPLGFPKAVPVHVTGFSGEAERVLRFDLSFMGFELVSDKNAARFIIQKNNAATIGAQVIDPLANKIPYNKAFSGGSVRQQTHALADDLSMALLKQPGIAQTRVAFKVQPTGYGAGEIYVADYDGFGASAVTKDNAICAAPAWSGKSALFYVSYKVSNKPEILFHNLATGERKQVAKFNGLNTSPAVKPGGGALAMILSRTGSPDLWVSDLNGGNLRHLTTTKEDESSPCWSPDGSRICLVSRQSGKPALYTIPASGGKMAALPSGAPSPTEPDWSPDGKYIIFTAQTGAGFQIYLLPMEGPARGQSIPLVAGEDPVWAPNSRAVMFVRNVNNRRVLALLDVPSKQIKDIIPVPGSASQPSWAR